MPTDPLISVIIPAYNRAHTVAETVDSVLGQTYTNLEVIVVDDGSRDNTQEVLQSYGGRIKNIQQANAGQMVARNRGIAEARGEIITFLDSDDIWMPTCVERHVKLLQKTGPEVPCSLANGWLEFSDGRRITSFQNSSLEAPLEEGLWLNPADVLPTRFVMFCQFVAIRREALKIVRGFDEDLKYMEDYALPLRLSLLGSWGFIREPLVVWRQGAADTVSVSQRALKQARPLRESLLVIRKRYLQDIAGMQEYKRAQQLQKRELWHDKMELRAIGLREQGSKIRGDLLFNAIKYRKAALRRTRSFARMKVKALSL